MKLLLLLALAASAARIERVRRIVTAETAAWTSASAAAVTGNFALESSVIANAPVVAVGVDAKDMPQNMSGLLSAYRAAVPDAPQLYVAMTERFPALPEGAVAIHHRALEDFSLKMAAMAALLGVVAAIPGSFRRHLGEDTKALTGFRPAAMAMGWLLLTGMAMQAGGILAYGGVVDHLPVMGAYLSTGDVLLLASAIPAAFLLANNLTRFSAEDYRKARLKKAAKRA